MSYQDRKDIDTLYDLIWDNDSNQLLLVKKEDYEAYKTVVEESYYDKVQSDSRYSYIGHTHDYATMEEVQALIDEIISGGADLTNYYTKTESDETFAPISHVSSTTAHNITEQIASAVSGLASTSDVSSAVSTHNSDTNTTAHSGLFNGKLSTSHASDSNAHSSLFSGKLDTSHNTSSSAHTDLFNSKLGTGHNTDNTAHNDIRTLISAKPSSTDISNAISTHNSDATAHSQAIGSHNTSSSAHSDIRTAISNLPTSSDISSAISTHHSDNDAHETTKIYQSINGLNNLKPFFSRDVDGQTITSGTTHQYYINVAIDSKVGSMASTLNSLPSLATDFIAGTQSSDNIDDNHYPTVLAVKKFVEGTSTYKRSNPAEALDITIPTSGDYTDIYSFYKHSGEADVSGSIDAQWMFERILEKLKGIYSTLSSLASTYAPINHSHDWEEQYTSAGTLEVNEKIRLAKYHESISFNFTQADTPLTIYSGVIPSEYRPSYTIPSATTVPNIVAMINSSGDFNARSPSTGSKTVNTTIIWRY